MCDVIDRARSQICFASYIQFYIKETGREMTLHLDITMCSQSCVKGSLVYEFKFLYFGSQDARFVFRLSRVVSAFCVAIYLLYMHWDKIAVFASVMEGWS